MSGEAGMYSVTIEGSFSAVHRVPMASGELEPMHGHDWLVRASFCSRELDASGMVVDFLSARDALSSILERLHHRDLNEVSALREFGAYPTAEVVARFVFEGLAGAKLGAVARVEVTEAPGCVGAYERFGDG